MTNNEIFLVILIKEKLILNSSKNLQIKVVSRQIWNMNYRAQKLETHPCVMSPSLSCLNTSVIVALRFVLDFLESMDVECIFSPFFQEEIIQSHSFIFSTLFRSNKRISKPCYVFPISFFLFFYFNIFPYLSCCM